MVEVEEFLRGPDPLKQPFSAGERGLQSVVTAVSLLWLGIADSRKSSVRSQLEVTTRLGTASIGFASTSNIATAAIARVAAILQRPMVVGTPEAWCHR